MQKLPASSHTCFQEVEGPLTFEDFRYQSIRRYCIWQSDPSTTVTSDPVFWNNLFVLSIAQYGYLHIHRTKDEVWDEIIPIASQIMNEMYGRKVE